jgi:hypothetical protein
MKRRKITGENVFTSLLELLGVKHTRKFSNRYFNEHPHKYNLFGISQMLSDYGVENAATHVVDKEKDIYEIETPFVAHVGSDFTTVYRMDKEKIHFKLNDKDFDLPVNEFLAAWSGIILLAEPKPDAEEPYYKKHRKEELLNAFQNYGLLFAGGLLLILGYISSSLYQNLGLNLLLFFNFLGVYTGYLLVLKQLHVRSRYVDKICSLFKQHDCNDVLQSNAARLWGIFGWSEIGLGYFIACSFVILFLPYLIPYLVGINILALPYSFWSIWYQKFKAKQWCVLCLIVQALFWLVFIVELVFGYIQIPNFNVINCLFTGSLFAVSILAVNILIPKLSQKRLVTYLKQEINSIKADEDVFRALLTKRPHYEVSRSDSQILFGNPDAQLFITIVSNPYCNPCAFMHKRMERFLEKTDNKVCVQYILSSFGEELEDINKCLIAVSLGKDKEETMQIFSEWFEKEKSQGVDFFAQFQLNMDNPEIETEFEKHKTWMEQSRIRATPTVLVNGYQLPDNYRIEDLRYFTEFNVDVK